MKRRITAVMALLMGLGVLLSACAPGGSAATTAAAAEKPAEFRMFFQTGGQDIPDGFDFKDNWFIRYICETANVSLSEVIVPNYADTATKFNLMMASGSIPDLVERADVNGMKNYGAEGAFQPIAELVKGSGVISARYTDEQLRAMQSLDGVQYVLITPPSLADCDNFLVRLDLLEEMGYDHIPDTIEGITEACRRLKELYPDSIPLTGPGVGSFRSSWMVWPFNTDVSGWKYRPERGCYTNAWEGGDIVGCVTWLRDIYEEGILDPEFVTSNGDDNAQKRSTRKVLYSSSNSGTDHLWAQWNLAEEPEAKLVPIPVPLSENAGIERHISCQSLLGTYAFGISTQTTDKDTLQGILRFLEVLYSDEVKQMADYGRENEEFRYEGGLPVATEQGMSCNWRAIYGWMFINNIDQITYNWMNVIDMLSSRTETEKKALKEEIVANYENVVTETLTRPAVYNPASFAGILSDEMTNRKNEAVELQKSLFLQAVVGDITIERFEQECEALIRKYQDVTDAYNELIAPVLEEYELKFRAD